MPGEAERYAKFHVDTVSDEEAIPERPRGSDPTPQAVADWDLILRDLVAGRCRCFPKVKS